ERAYYWRYQEPCPWNGGEAKNLKQLLLDFPKLEKIKFAHWLKNYFMSQDYPPGERPRSFLPRISNYSIEPLDRFSRSQNATIENAQAQRARRNRAALEQAEKNSRLASNPDRNLPPERIEPRRDRTLGTGFSALRDCGD